MNTIYFLFKIALLMLVAPYIIGPILVYFLQKLPHQYKFKIIDPDDFLSERSETFSALHEEIQTQGFEHLASSELIQSNSSMHFSFYNNLKLELACTLSTAHSKPENTTQIEFTQLYEDGSALSVNNNSLLSAFPADKQKLVYRFPDINDIEQLLDATQKLANKNKLNKNPENLKPGAEISTIEAWLNAETQSLIAKGWVSKKIENDRHRLTIKGAAFMTWKLCWPMKKILAKKEETFAKNALEHA